MIFLFTLLAISIKFVTPLYTVPPTWLTSSYVRAGNKNIISTLTGNTVTPTFIFTFSSPLPGTPFLGYGIKAYQGGDWFGEEYFEVYLLSLNSTNFKVAVQILGSTYIYTLNVPYIAIDPNFPHHLNTFDNVPVNYSAGALTNVTLRTSYVQTYTNTINYTYQAAGMRYTRFQTPLSRNKVLLFMTSCFLAGSNQGTTTPLRPINLSVKAEVLSTTQYRITVSLVTNISLTRLHFSQVVFDETDVLSSGAYMLVYYQISWLYTGGFEPVPVAFIDNFIMGLTDFSSNKTQVILDFQWDFATINGVHGAYMPLSIGVSRTNSYNETVNRFTYTLFYMKTWLCPNVTIETFFDPATNLCTQCPVQKCLNCQGLNICSQCDTANNYTMNADRQCQLICSYYSNTISIVPGSVSNCICQTNFYWQDLSCIRNCSNISYATVLIRGSIEDCQCLPKFSWNSSSGICVVDCGNIADAIRLVPGTINKCQCSVGYIWLASTFRCDQTKCAFIPYATNLVPGSTVDCQCEPNFLWNAAADKCLYNCQAISYTSGLAPNRVDSCSCIAQFVWISADSICQRDCGLYQYTTGLNEGSNEICKCQQKFNWDGLNRKCIIQCDSLDHNSGLVTNSYDTCQCDTMYLWNQTALDCLIKCGIIPNAVSLSTWANDVCTCRSGYSWNSTTLQCLFVCENIQFTNGRIPGTDNQCYCDNKFIWDTSILKCVIQCGGIAGALSIVDGEFGKCNCKDKYVWNNLEKACIFDCAQVENTVGFVDGTTDQCLCPDGFFWNKTIMNCAMNCSNIPHAIGLVEGSLMQCQCLRSYRWKRTLQTCILSCQDIEYTEMGWSLPDDIICPCLNGFKWNTTIKQCQYNCSSVQNATGEVMEGTTDRCICIEAHIWDDVDMTCKGKQFDYLLGSVVGLGVVSVAALVNFVFLSVKKKILSMAFTSSQVVNSSSAAIIT